MASDGNYAVRLMSVASLVGNIEDIEQVRFNVTPRFSESREVEYTPVAPIHMPGSIQVYKNTRSRTFSVGAHFISRTPDEATLNMIYLQRLRGWTMPYFGATTTVGSSNGSSNQENMTATVNQGQQDSEVPISQLDQIKNLAGGMRRTGYGMELLGAPPDVLYLYAYSSGDPRDKVRSGEYGVNINKVPVVITSLNITYPDDVDYIPTRSHKDIQDSEPFPIKMDVDITLVETHSPREYEQFNLMSYKRGVLVNF